MPPTPKAAPTTLVNNEFVTIWYHPVGRIVHHVVHKQIQGAAFRELLTTGADVFEQRKAQKWLSDDRLNGALHPDDAAWATSEWSPRVVKAGWKYWALVMPDAVLGKLNMKRFINMYRELGVTVEIFDDPDEALTWLQSAK